MCTQIFDFVRMLNYLQENITILSKGLHYFQFWSFTYQFTILFFNLYNNWVTQVTFYYGLAVVHIPLLVNIFLYGIFALYQL